MTGRAQFTDTWALGDARGNRGICDKMLVGLVLCTLVRAADAVAGEQAPIAGASIAPEMSELRPPSVEASRLPLPAAFEPRPVPDTKTFSPTDFTPRKPSVFDAEPIAVDPDEAPMLHGTTVWQRLSQYRVHDRVRLLTLWQSGASTVSLQAGKRGSPSLQWTNRLSNHGEITHGLLDRLLSVRIAGAGSALHGTARAAPLPVTSKPVNLSGAGGAPGYTPESPRP